MSLYFYVSGVKKKVLKALIWSSNAAATSFCSDLWVEALLCCRVTTWVFQLYFWEMDRKCGRYPLRWAGVWAKSVSACHTSGHFYRNFFFRHLRTSQGRSALTVSPRGVKFTLYNPVNFGRKKKHNWHTAFGFRSSGVFNSKTVQ